MAYFRKIARSVGLIEIYLKATTLTEITGVWRLVFQNLSRSVLKKYMTSDQHHRIWNPRLVFYMNTGTINHLFTPWHRVNLALL
jgi:hypothetical protein